jgi:SpoVK/Ycf46/Vps4 family AAA+-type ATPase
MSHLNPHNSKKPRYHPPPPPANKHIIFVDDEDEDNPNNDDDNITVIEEEEEDDDLEEEETEEETLPFPINTLDDLIRLGEQYSDYPIRKRPRWNLDITRLIAMLPSLHKLNNMIGMKSVKNTIVDMVMYYLQDFEKANSNMLHTVIEGPPGTGKTEIAKIIADIYLKLGILQNNTFRIAKRSDLIGGYLGQTAIKTQKVIDEARGGVLFIDEAYSLGNPEGRDSYSKECIDTLNLNLTENKAHFICIIAGYRNSLKESFFSVNPGLERRFPFRFIIEEYTSTDLMNIYKKIVKDNEWMIQNILQDIKQDIKPDIKQDIKPDKQNKEMEEFFETNRVYFKFNGGDMETLFQMTKIAHSRRVFCLHRKHKKKITMEDIQKALQLFMNNENVKNRIEVFNPLPMMYL